MTTAAYGLDARAALEGDGDTDGEASGDATGERSGRRPPTRRARHSRTRPPTVTMTRTARPRSERSPGSGRRASPRRRSRGSSSRRGPSHRRPPTGRGQGPAGRPGAEPRTRPTARPANRPRVRPPARRLPRWRRTRPPMGPACPTGVDPSAAATRRTATPARGLPMQPPTPADWPRSTRPPSPAEMAWPSAGHSRTATPATLMGRRERGASRAATRRDERTAEPDGTGAVAEGPARRCWTGRDGSADRRRSRHPRHRRRRGRRPRTCLRRRPRRRPCDGLGNGHGIDAVVADHDGGPAGRVEHHGLRRGDVERGLGGPIERAAGRSRVLRADTIDRAHGDDEAAIPLSG